jgi:hypothetical protein
VVRTVFDLRAYIPADYHAPLKCFVSTNGIEKVILMHDVAGTAIIPLSAISSCRYGMGTGFM